jgi:hypothetical protein
MNPARSSPPARRTEPPTLSPWRWVGYVAGLVAAEIACYQLALSSYTSCWLPPLLAEMAFLGAPPSQPPPSYRTRFLGRCAGIIVASLFIHYAYVLPVVYHDGTPWDEEGLWRIVVVAAQGTVAAGISLLRWLRPAPTNTHFI